MGTTSPDEFVRLPGGVGWGVAPKPARTSDGAVIPLSKDTQLQQAEIAYGTWFVKVPHQYAIEDVMEPAFWRHIELHVRHRQVRPKQGDLIRIVRADDAFDALFRIDEVNAGYRLSFYAGQAGQT
jgi:hypothetical protein